jgi:pescadillo
MLVLALGAIPSGFLRMLTLRPACAHPQLIETAPYAPGATLPAHLSPFVHEGADDYVPPERTALARRAATDEEEAAALEAEEDGDEEEEEDDEEDGAAALEDEASGSDEEAVYRKEMRQELQGKTCVVTWGRHGRMYDGEH